MGTTQDAIRGGNCQLAYVLAIEGYKYLLTDGDPAKAVTAWAATAWSDALPGLRVKGAFRQSLAPWSNEVQVPRFTFEVQPESTDQFGIDMFKAKPGVRSELTAGFASDADGAGFNISVQDAGLFAASSPVFIGTEAFNVTGTPTGTSIPVPAAGAGYLAPFGTNSGAANRFPGPHALPAGEVVGAYESTTPVYVTDAPPSWIGKKVGLYVHRVTAGVLDTYAQAELWFAGTITRVSEAGLMTVVECDGIQQALVDATLMQDQWVGRIKTGHEFEVDDFVWVSVMRTSGTNLLQAAAKFTAVAASPGADEFLAGSYTAEEFGSMLAEHLDGDATIGVSGSGITLRWSANVSSESGGLRFKLKAQESASMTGAIGMASNSATILKFLGFTDLASDYYGNHVKWSDSQAAADIALVSDDPPYLITPTGPQSRAGTITVEDSSGTFVDHTSILPPQAREHVTGAEVWSYYIIGDDTLVLGRRDSATQISGVTLNTGISGLAATSLVEVASKKKAGEAVLIKQVFFASGTFASIIAKLFASTDGQGNNHATYDVLPFGAGIPWGLLGQSFLDSLSALEQSGIEDSLALIIEKPTRLWDAIACEFALRMAAICWKDGGLQAVQLSVPNASTADFALDETNKSDTERTITEATSEFLAHTVKVEFNRNPITGKYHDHYIARDKTAYESAGGAGATKTIKARNSYSGGIATGSSAEALADMITSRFLPVLAKPLKRYRRSIPHTLFHMVPGDTASVTDDFVRDPATGIRGITNRPTTALAVTHALGISSGGDQTYMGECELLYTEEDRLFPLSPSAEHATVTSGTYTSGWDSTNVALLVNQHSYSDSTEATDGSQFASGDAVRVTEIDPADPAAADSFIDTIASGYGIITIGPTNYDEVFLTSGFGVGGRPAFDSTKTYIINSDSYTNASADQKLHAYQADDADGQILDTAQPNLMSDQVKIGSAAASLTELPSRHSAEQFGDGEPLSASFVRDQIRMANNLTNYKTAPHSPFMKTGVGVITSPLVTGNYVVVWTIPCLIGNENWTGGRKRVLNVAPYYKSGGGTAKVRITSSANPPKGDDSTWEDTTWQGPKNQIEFTKTSTAYGIDTAQELDVVRAEGMPEFTWITVEGSDVTQILGIAELWLGPLQ